MTDLNERLRQHIKLKNIEYFPYSLSLIELEDIIGTPIKEQYPNHADLDFYSGVTYNDYPKGRLFMETKIVKWLIENRVKDYWEQKV